MLGFDRGGAYPQVFSALPRARTCTGSPAGGHRWRSRHAAGHHHDHHRRPDPDRSPGPRRTCSSRTTGEARQITLFEHGRVALQILTSDSGACPADILSWLKSRWREENFLKYASENYGIDKICDYAAAIETNTKITDNPARKAANTAAQRDTEKEVAAAERDLAALLADPATTAAAKNAAHPRRRARDQRRAAGKHGRRGRRPGHDPGETARQPDRSRSPHRVLRTGRRGLQMVLRLLAHNAEHWLANSLNAYLRDDDEYRAITRETIIRGLAGTITFTPAAVTVDLQAARRTPRRPRPGPGHHEINATAARHPRRHPAHHLPHPPAAANLTRGPLPFRRSGERRDNPARRRRCESSTLKG